MKRQEEDLQIRHMAQDAGLDRDPESMVPPTYSTTSVVIIVALLCVLIVVGLAVALTTF